MHESSGLLWFLSNTNDFVSILKVNWLFSVVLALNYAVGIAKRTLGCAIINANVVSVEKYFISDN